MKELSPLPVFWIFLKKMKEKYNLIMKIENKKDIQICRIEIQEKYFDWICKEIVPYSWSKKF